MKPLLLNLRKTSKEDSKKQRILSRIKIRASWGKNSTDDDKTESDKDSDNGDDNDVSDNEDENKDSDDVDNVNDFDKDSNVENDQTVDFVIRPHVKEPVQEQLEPQPHSPSVTITSHEDVQTIQETQEDPAENVIETPPATPPTKTNKKRAKTLLKKAIQKKNDWKKAVKQRLEDHEKRLNALSQDNNLLPKADSDFVQHRLEGTVLDVINKNLVNLFQSNSTITADPTEYELKLQLINDPPENHEGKKKIKRQKGASGSSSKKGKAQEDTSYYERVEDAKEPRQVEEQEHEAQSDVLEEELEEHKPPQQCSVTSWKMKNKFLNKDKITKEDLEGPAFELLKNRFKNSGKLAYNLEQYHIALTDKID
ncbi:hypothetical protein Tco_1236340 [Tanacetum coccineum]